MGESSKKEKKSKKKEKKTEEEAEAPKDEGGDDAAAEDKPEPKRAARGTSNVFALFNQSQIQEFKEAFTMIDQNRDGIICEEDLGAIYQQIGRDPDPAVLAKMIKEAPGQLNFTHFLTLFGEKLHGRDPKPEIIKKMVEESPTALNFTSFLTLLGGKLTGTDSESCLRDAFTMFDENKVGTLSEDYMKDLLTNVGDIFSKDELKALWKEAPIEGGQFDYLKMTRIIKRGDEDE